MEERGCLRLLLGFHRKTRFWRFDRSKVMSAPAHKILAASRVRLGGAVPQSKYIDKKYVKNPGLPFSLPGINTRNISNNLKIES